MNAMLTSAYTRADKRFYSYEFPLMQTGSFLETLK